MIAAIAFGVSCTGISENPRRMAVDNGEAMGLEARVDLELRRNYRGNERESVIGEDKPTQRGEGF